MLNYYGYAQSDYKRGDSTALKIGFSTLLDKTMDMQLLIAKKKFENQYDSLLEAKVNLQKKETNNAVNDNNNNNNGNNNNSNRNQKNNQNNNRNQFVKNDQPKKNGQNGQNGNNRQNGTAQPDYQRCYRKECKIQNFKQKSCKNFQYRKNESCEKEQKESKSNGFLWKAEDYI